MSSINYLNLLTGLYWWLILLWLIILVFYWREYRRITRLSPMVGTMLVVVFIDGARTLLENIYFGVETSARSSAISHDIYDILNEPQLQLLPKLLTLGSALVILFVLVRKWFPNMSADIERQQKNQQLYEELQSAHEELQSAREAQEALTHMIVHDMRTPLTSVITGLQTFQLIEQTSSVGSEMLEGALTGANRLLLMVNDLLDLSKMEAGEMPLAITSFHASEVVQDTVSLVAALVKEKNLKLEQRLLEPNNLELSADREKIRRVLVNLVANSVKFTPDGGTVTIEVKPDRDAHIRFSVSDTGPGIAEEHQIRIFEKFYQVSHGPHGQVAATGLGLAFCRMAVEAHGGEIGVESELGNGATFWFTLPKTRV